MTLDELSARCRGEVIVHVNANRSDYMDLAEYLSEDFEDLAREDKARLIAAGNIVELQFYPHTPVGFYHVVEVTLEAALRKAEECMVEADAATGVPV